MSMPIVYIRSTSKTKDISYVILCVYVCKYICNRDKYRDRKREKRHIITLAVS